MTVIRAWGGPKTALFALLTGVGVLAIGCTEGTTGSGASPPTAASSPTTTQSASETPSAPATARPSSSTSAPSPSTAAPTPTGVALFFVNWSAVNYGSAHFPTDCKPDVRHVTYPPVEAGVLVAVVQVSCQSGAGTPPSALLVFDRAQDTTTPHLAQTVISYYDDFVFDSFSASGPALSASVGGYLSGRQPIYGPLVWTWAHGRYELRTTIPSHEPICGAPSCTPITTVGEATLPSHS